MVDITALTDDDSSETARLCGALFELDDALRGLEPSAERERVQDIVNYAVAIACAYTEKRHVLHKRTGPRSCVELRHVTYVPDKEFVGYCVVEYSELPLNDQYALRFHRFGVGDRASCYTHTLAEAEALFERVAAGLSAPTFASTPTPTLPTDSRA